MGCKRPRSNSVRVYLALRECSPPLASRIVSSVTRALTVSQKCACPADHVRTVARGSSMSLEIAARPAGESLSAGWCRSSWSPNRLHARDVPATARSLPSPPSQGEPSCNWPTGIHGEVQPDAPCGRRSEGDRHRVPRSHRDDHLHVDQYALPAVELHRQHLRVRRSGVGVRGGQLLKPGDHTNP